MSLRVLTGLMLALSLSAPTLWAAEAAPAVKLVEVKKIWDQAPTTPSPT